MLGVDNGAKKERSTELDPEPRRILESATSRCPEAMRWSSGYNHVQEQHGSGRQGSTCGQMGIGSSQIVAYGTCDPDVST